MSTQEFNQQAQTLWDSGQRSQAIECVIKSLNEYASKQKPKALFMQFTYYLFLIEDYASASKILEDAASAYPNDLDIKVNLVVTYSRNKAYEKAIEIGEQIVKIDHNQFVVWDVLANCYAKTQQYELATMAGNHSLDIKNEQFSNPIQNWILPTQSISSYIAIKKSVIAFSLWGNQERYINGAVRNLLLKNDLYPEWEIWIYIDNSVSNSTQDLLTKLGAKLIQQTANQSLKQKLCWRFLVANHPEVGRFLVRDIDSVFSLRERMAVEEWIESENWFHTIHDWWTHTDLILAGLWGGVANVLPNVWKMLESYEPKSLTTPNIDQWFLRDCLWSYVKQSCLLHDRCFRQKTSKPIPGPSPRGNHHIGCCEFSQNPGQQRLLVSAWLNPN